MRAVPLLLAYPILAYPRPPPAPSNTMKLLFVLLFFLLPSLVRGVPGDLNLDGVVDFSDFFIFADNFGKSGPTELDTIEVTVNDTIYLERETSVLDTVEITVNDTIYLPSPGPSEAQITFTVTSDTYEEIDNTSVIIIYDDRLTSLSQVSLYVTVEDDPSLKLSFEQFVAEEYNSWLALYNLLNALGRVPAFFPDFEPPRYATGDGYILIADYQQRFEGREVTVKFLVPH